MKASGNFSVVDGIHLIPLPTNTQRRYGKLCAQGTVASEDHCCELENGNVKINTTGSDNGA